ncbi:MAG: hypothetical protein JO117_00920, partial [Verrucomicrobia bacterium]|nr:hypothetical protein [Verrucomicrobiota bacterium]
MRIQPAVTDGFIHPGIGLTKETLENARAQILAKREPWHSGYVRMAANPNSAPSISIRNQSKQDPTKPDSDVFDSRGMVTRLGGDSDKAYHQALMYWLTGEENFRANAMNIIRVWSKLDPKKFRSFTEDHIHACYPVQNLIRAAELMRYTSTTKSELVWTDKDTVAFTNNFVVPSLTTFFNRNGHFMNQAGYPMTVTLAGDIFTNNRADYESRIEWFTVNKNAPNKGWSFSIQDLARLVDTNATTREKAAQPQVQIMEMGRDQAHGGDDVEIFTNVARMLNVQGTKVDPVTGVVSTKPDAVGVYEFLGDRILAAADYFCRFMLGYDTPWIPAAYDIAPGGKVRAIYPRIADNYRGRVQQFEYWDLYYYYTFGKGVDLATKARYYNEAYLKRINEPDTDWIYIPKNVSGAAAKPMASARQPGAIDLDRQSTPLDANAAVVTEGNAAFLRVKSTPDGTRVAILGGDTKEKVMGLRVRTTGGAAEITMSGFKQPWLLPDTKGEWRRVTYRMDELEHLGNIVFFTVKSPASAQVDLDSLSVRGGENQSAPQFSLGDGDLNIITSVGLPVRLDLSVKDKSNGIQIASLDKPADAALDGETGAFQWMPKTAGNQEFVVSATKGEFVTAKKIRVTVAPNRLAAVQTIAAARDPKVLYVEASLRNFQQIANQTVASIQQMDDRVFFAKLMELQAAAEKLEPLTPLLPDGSMDFPKLVVSSNIGASTALLT